MVELFEEYRLQPLSLEKGNGKILPARDRDKWERERRMIYFAAKLPVLDSAASRVRDKNLKIRKTPTTFAII
jgi:hypothetical protein